MLEHESSEDQGISQDEIPTVISQPETPPSSDEDGLDTISETLMDTVIPQGTVSPRAKRKSRLGTIPVIRPMPAIVTELEQEEVDMSATIVEAQIPSSPTLPEPAQPEPAQPDLGNTMSPFDDGAEDEDEDGDILTKTSTNRRLDSAELDSMDSEADPEVITRTVVDAPAVGREDLSTTPSAPATKPVPVSVPVPEEPLPSVSTLDPSMVYMPGEYALPQAQLQPPTQYPQPESVHAPAMPVLSPPPNDYPQAEYPRAQSPYDESYPDAALHALENEVPPDAPADTANPAWRQAHPSTQRWAEKRNARARSPQAGGIALGLILAGLGSYLLALFLPSKAPLTAAAIAQMAEQAGVDVSAWRFEEDLFTLANLNAALLVGLGVVVVIRGALHRQSSKESKMSVFLVFCTLLLVMSFVGLALFASV